MPGQSPPTIGITCSTFQRDQGQRPPNTGQNRSYVDAVIRAGAAPLLIPNVTDRTLLRTLYDLLDGLLLSGGGDIDPGYYGESRHRACGIPDPERDETELALIRWAIEEGKPLLAICRGIQVLNVALGGTLYQDLQAQAPEAERHNWSPGYARDYVAHSVSIGPQTRLRRIVGADPLPVNSFHHQAIKDVAPGLTVTARAPDRIIEAVEGEGHTFVVGVQWHPEGLAREDTRAQNLFDVLVNACRR
ncbi:MAG: gamma-glutamyl-gamma-aminobutyrate hydrolase family protein [Anaerolineae bacterium]